MMVSGKKRLKLATKRPGCYGLSSSKSAEGFVRVRDFKIRTKDGLRSAWKASLLQA